MKKILITGSVINSNNKSKKTYEKLVNICIENKYEVSSPLDTMKFTGTDEERYKRAMRLVDSADIIIAEMSIPSTGQGMELQQAIINDIPILILANDGSNISGLIKGSKQVIDILYYDDIDKIKQKIIEIIKCLERR